MIDALLEILIEQARQDRDHADVTGSNLEVKRAYATTVTKLEEAQMWRARAENMQFKL